MGHVRIAFWAVVLLLILSGAVITDFGTRWPALYYMTGPSMEPSLPARQFFFAWSPPEEIRRGALVLFRFVDEGEEYHVLRRVAALPGDTISMQDGRVVVNGIVQEWPYRIERAAAWRSPLAIGGNLFTWGPWVVPRDSLVLLADMRDMTGWPDSRFLGFIAVEEIVATAGRTVSGRTLH
jgi:signal peptidase I